MTRQFYGDDFSHLWNLRLRTNSCLYVLQCLPCSWREFIRQCEKLEGVPDSDIQQTSKHRVLAEAVLRLQSSRLNDLHEVLQRTGLQTLFDQLPIALQRSIFTDLRFGGELNRAGLLRFFKGRARAAQIERMGEWGNGNGGMAEPVRLGPRKGNSYHSFKDFKETPHRLVSKGGDYPKTLELL